MKRVLIVSAHADDEVFGMGVTLSRFHNEGVALHWLILTALWEPRWSRAHIERRDNQIKAVGERLGFESVSHWDFRDNRLDTYPLDDIQRKFIDKLDELKPDTLFTPGPWDFNFEHKLACQLVEMCTKPTSSPYLRSIFSYEIPSSTEWSFQSRDNFLPTTYFALTQELLDDKLALCAIYEEELFDTPHGRSVEYVRALAVKRGIEAGQRYAEAFHLFREIR